MLKLHTGFEEPQPETTPALEPNMTNHVSMNMTTYDYINYYIIIIHLSQNATVHHG